MSVSTMTDLYCVIGHPVAHSRGPVGPVHPEVLEVEVPAQHAVLVRTSREPRRVRKEDHMFVPERGKFYRMPVPYGPMPGPRQIPAGKSVDHRRNPKRRTISGVTKMSCGV